MQILKTTFKAIFRDSLLYRKMGKNDPNFLSLQIHQKYSQNIKKEKKIAFDLFYIMNILNIF